MQLFFSKIFRISHTEAVKFYKYFIYTMKFVL